MADVKISALPLASTPLAGTEVLPIVQSATTDQVTVANLTAGRAVSASSLTLTTTPLAVGSGGTGSNAFTANYIPYSNGTILTSSANVQTDGSNILLGGLTASTGAFNRGIYITSGASNIAGVQLTNTASGTAFNSGAQYYLNGSTATLINYASGSLALTTATANSITFATNNATAMTLSASGNLGINTSTPSYKLHVTGGTADASHYAYFSGNVGTGSAPTTTFGLLIGANYSAGNSETNIIWGQGVSSSQYLAIGKTTGSAYTEQMRIDSVGDVGIGCSAGADIRFRVQGQGTSTTKYSFWVQNSTPTATMWVRDDGYCALPVTYGSFTTASAANVFINTDGGLFRSTSSQRYKINVQDAIHGLADVLNLRSVTYNGINDGDKIFGGLIAEEVDAAGLTEFVVYDEEGAPDALHYGNMAGLFVKAIQELAAKVAKLEAKI